MQWNIDKINLLFSVDLFHFSNLFVYIDITGDFDSQWVPLAKV